jgi:hypothetical protein
VSGRYLFIITFGSHRMISGKRIIRVRPMIIRPRKGMTPRMMLLVSIPISSGIMPLKKNMA